MALVPLPPFLPPEGPFPAWTPEGLDVSQASACHTTATAATGCCMGAQTRGRGSRGLVACLREHAAISQLQAQHCTPCAVKAQQLACTCALTLKTNVAIMGLVLLAPGTHAVSVAGQLQALRTVEGLGTDWQGAGWGRLVESSRWGLGLTRGGWGGCRSSWQVGMEGLLQLVGEAGCQGSQQAFTCASAVCRSGLTTTIMAMVANTDGFTNVGAASLSKRLAVGY